ncbi:hypothetical protein ACTFIY_006076 [Dictyostelium cf. discoideum]
MDEVNTQPMCFCNGGNGPLSCIRSANTEKNPGRNFYTCKALIDGGCGYFQWVDEFHGKDGQVRRTPKGFKSASAILKEKKENQNVWDSCDKKKIEEWNKLIETIFPNIFKSDEEMLSFILSFSLNCFKSLYQFLNIPSEQESITNVNKKRNIDQVE